MLSKWSEEPSDLGAMLEGTFERESKKSAKGGVKFARVTATFAKADGMYAKACAKFGPASGWKNAGRLCRSKVMSRGAKGSNDAGNCCKRTAKPTFARVEGRFGRAGGTSGKAGEIFVKASATSAKAVSSAAGPPAWNRGLERRLQVPVDRRVTGLATRKG